MLGIEGFGGLRVYDNVPKITIMFLPCTFVCNSMLNNFIYPNLLLQTHKQLTFLPL
jgi:hypothetical protein